jgi:hypothetical protein
MITMIITNQKRLLLPLSAFTTAAAAATLYAQFFVGSMSVGWVCLYRGWGGGLLCGWVLRAVMIYDALRGFLPRALAFAGHCIS